MKKFPIALLTLILFGHTVQTIASQTTPTATPVADPKVPFQIQIPWPSGIGWEAGGDGSHYGDFKHQKADYYAVDFNAPDDDSDKGTLVLAAADGVVVDSDCANGSYGCRVVIAHPLVENYCYQSMYAHLQSGSILVEDKDYISQGHPLGRVGSTGLDSGNHLHFSVHRRPVEECSSQQSKNDISMAVKPEPLGGQIPSDFTVITSTTYPVGYEKLSQEQIEEGADLPERHEEIFKLYQFNGGHFGRFGSALGPVKQFSEGFYQEFGPYKFNEELDWYELSSVIVEYESGAFFMYRPIWDKFIQDVNKYGFPIANSYRWNQNGSMGFRSDFSNNVSIILIGSNSIKVIENNEATWAADFFNKPNTFTEPTHYRTDEYIDFHWENSSKPGPFEADDGFSARWETEVGGWVSAYNLRVKFQGHIIVKVEGEVAFEESSPNGVWEGESRQFGIGAEKIEVLYWQQGSLPGELSISVSNYIDIIPSVFASEGQISSSSSEVPQLTFSEFAPALRDEPITGPGECSISSSDGVELYSISDFDSNSFIACIDLSDPYLRFETVLANDVMNVNPPSDQREKVTSMVGREPYIFHHPLLAYNIDYFGEGHGPEGFTVKNGLRIDGPFSKDLDGNEVNRVSQSISRVNWVELDNKSSNEVSNPILHLGRFYNASGGGPTILKGGNVINDPCEAEGFPPTVCRVDTHTAVGISEDRLTFIVVVAESKSAMEVGQILQAYGADSGIKLSGGTTSQLWYRGEDKVLGNPVANAIVVFNEEIPRHDSLVLEQSQFPVVQAGEPFTASFRLANTGFLPWESQLDYALINTGGEAFNISSPIFLPQGAKVATHYDTTFILNGIAPVEVGPHQSIWQLIYQDSNGNIESIGAEMGFLVTVIPEGASPDFGDSLQQLIDQFVDEIEGNVRDYLDDLQKQIEDRIRAEIIKMLPPEIRCLLGLSVIMGNAWGLSFWSRKRKYNV